MAETIYQRCDRLIAENEELREQVIQLRSALMGAEERCPIRGLAPIESRIFRLIAARKTGASRSMIFDVVYLARPDTDIPETNIISVHVGKIRKKLAGSGISIETVWGWGYRLSPESLDRLREMEEVPA